MNAYSPTAPSHNPQPVVPHTQEPTPEQRQRAVRAVASAAADAQDCADLLAALGLAPEEGKSPEEDERIPPQRDR